MNPRHRLAAIPAFGLVAALGLPALLAVPAVAIDGGKQVAEVTELRDAKTSEQLLAGEDTSVVDPEDFTSVGSTLRPEDGAIALAGRPATFDLRSCDLDGDGELESYVTPVKLQNPFGTCWSFGSTAAVETSLLSETGQGVPAGQGNDTVDLSEKDLAWFAKNPQPSGDQAGEGIHTGSEEPASKLAGGYISTATSLYAMGNGPIDESRDPVLEYHNNAATEDGQYEIVDLTGLSEAERRALGIDDSYQLDTWMEPRPDGDWSVPEEWRGEADWELEETFYLPSPASFEPTGNPQLKTYRYNPMGVSAIKDQLLAGRGVGISYCADTASYLNPDTSAHYTYESPDEDPANGGTANHAVCIVGYDDTYSRENFSADHQPPGDGAFIVKNSWGGNDTSDPRNYRPWGEDGGGYFHLSYYDKSIRMPEAFDLLTTADGDSNYSTDPQASELYQHAFLPNDPTGTNHSAVTSYANVYEIRSDSVVRDVSTQTYSLGTQVRFDIYLMDPGATEPSDGALLWSHEETFPYGGYHRVEVGDTLLVHGGDRLGVVCTSKLPGGAYEVVNNQGPSRLAHDLQNADPTVGYWSEAVVNPGESFIGSPYKLVTYVDGTTAYEDYAWADYTGVIARSRERAEEALDEAGIDGLRETRDAAYSKLAGLTEDDAGYKAASAALDKAQKALDDAFAPIRDSAARGLAYAQDNFPLNITTEAVDGREDVDVYRVYNPDSGEHLYMTDAHERDVLVQQGWTDEGVGWVAPSWSKAPVYRLFNPFTGEHLYTRDGHEESVLTGLGWRYEGVAFYSGSAPANPVYRLNNPYEPGVNGHTYTTSVEERDQNFRDGWNPEGIAWYAA